jgi:uncharacterized membrane protein (DUF441 family)
MVEITASAVVIAAVVSGLVEAYKLAGLPKRYAPLASVLTGIPAAYFADKGGLIDGYDGNVGKIVIGGAVTGLIASGLYANVRIPSKR